MLGVATEIVTVENKNYKVMKLVDTGRVHVDSKGKPLLCGKQQLLCRIFRVVWKESRYSGADLRRLRAERGVGSVRRIIKES